MGFNATTIKLGRLFMVAWLAFFIYPLGAFLTDRLSTDTRTYGLLLLLALAALWAWFWTRIIGGPDRRYLVPAIVAATLILTVFTLRTPPQYGSLFLYAVIMAGSAFPWRRAAPALILLSVLAAAIELIRGESVTASTGQFLNDLLVGFAAVAGRLLVEANQQLNQAREQIARLAVGEERLRFARDLHDLLGHSLSVIALKSELAGRLIKNTPELAAHEIEDIEKVARDALREVREAVTGYRQPTLAAELAGAHEVLTAAGIEYHVDHDHVPLPPAVEAVLAWTVREGVTNVMRHSQAKRCAVRIINKDGHATAEVIDDGRGGTPEAGSGLRGLEERVRERGGTLTAEPLPHEGFRLRVTLPLRDVLAPLDTVSA
ncbi:MAG: sensor histidine kinase [Chloroflexota bacterium]|nr:MAG: sensor histidine kinase [Chloroflexota bacterium]